MNQRTVRRALFASGLLAAGVAHSAAALAAPECDSGRELSQASTGSRIGQGLVDQAFARISGDLSRIDEFKATVVETVGAALRSVALRAVSEEVEGSPALVCRAQGLVDGVIERLSQLQEETGCGEEGCEDGSLSSKPLSSKPLSSEPVPPLSESRSSKLPREGLRSVPSSPPRAAPGGALVRDTAPEQQIGFRQFFFCWMDGVFWGELVSSIYCSLSVELDGLVALGLELPPPSRSCCGFGFELACNLKFHSDARSDAECRPFTEAPHTEAYLENRVVSCTFEF